MSDQIKNIFISHIHEDDSGLPKLKELLGKNGMEARDYSITTDKQNNAKSDDYIKGQILGPRIKQCSVLAVYITPGTKNSDYVNWEIEYAQKEGLRIVGIWAEGEKGCPVPEALDKFHDAIVGWTGNSIIDAINGEVNGYQNPDGTESDSRDIARYSCG